MAVKYIVDGDEELAIAVWEKIYHELKIKDVHLFPCIRGETPEQVIVNQIKQERENGQFGARVHIYTRGLPDLVHLSYPEAEAPEAFQQAAREASYNAVFINGDPRVQEAYERFDHETKQIKGETIDEKADLIIAQMEEL